MNLLRLIQDPEQVSERALLAAKAKPICRHKATKARADWWAKQHVLSCHAQLRAKQRGLSQDDIHYVLRYGTRYYAANAIIYYLRHNNIPAEHRRSMDRLEGTAIFTAQERPWVITIWRNRQHGTRNLHRKLSQIWVQLVEKDACPFGKND
jgi:hypothetical protein